MSDAPNEPITRLLRASAQGDAEARDRVVSLLYDELRHIARSHRWRSRGHETLSTTALVHESFLRLSGTEKPEWQDRVHFLRVAARVMRNVLVDDARRRNAAKRGEGVTPESLDEAEVPGGDAAIKSDEVLAVHEALDRLEALDERQARIVELRYFVGLEVEETADVLGVSTATVKRGWALARAWLQREIELT